MIWTDGSAVEDEAGVSSAGAGIFFGDGNEKNQAIVVDGPQTSQRAELTAFLYCLENETEPIHIRTDSKYVQLGVRIWRDEWRAKAWYKKPQQGIEIEHADLWQKADDLLSQRKAGEHSQPGQKREQLESRERPRRRQRRRAT